MKKLGTKSFVASLLVNYIDLIRVLRFILWKIETSSSFKMMLFMTNMIIIIIMCTSTIYRNSNEKWNK